MPEFQPGSVHKATVAFSNPKSAGFDYVASFCMGAGWTEMDTASFHLDAGQSKAIAFQVTMPSTSGTYPVYFKVFCGGVLIGTFVATEGVTIVAPFYWLRPTGHIPGSWNDEELAYDGWTDTRAEVLNVGTQSWSPYLELTIEPTQISAVRWWGSSPVSPSKVQVDIRDEAGVYHNIFEGSAVILWDDGLPIPGGARVISGARIRFYNPARTIRMKFRVNEFEFFGAGDPPEPPIPPPTTKLFGYVTNRYTGAPIVGAVGTVYQDYDSDTEDYDLVTDSQGYYLIDNMLFEVDQTLMVIYADGYVTYTKERVSISKGDNRLDIRMYPE